MQRSCFHHAPMKRGDKPKGIAAANKKRKAEAAAGTPLDPALLSAVAAENAAAAFASARPVKHTVLVPVCKPDRLRAAFQQALHGLSADLHESDSAKLYQCKDLAELANDAAELSQVRALRDALYSAEMREMMASVVGCGSLADTVDCRACIYNEGCHVLPHALLPRSDHATRRLAFFFFLTPDEEWSEEDGAALELYDPADRMAHGPSAPRQSVLPQWNSMLIIDADSAGPAPVVGLSEVVSGEKTLMCISGWYYLAAGPGRGVGMTAWGGVTGGDGGGAAAAGAPLGLGSVIESGSAKSQTLSAGDKALLCRFVAEEYLAEDKIAEVCASFESDSAAKLSDFLKRDVAAAVARACRAADARDAVGRGRWIRPATGVDPAQWLVRGPVPDQRFLELLPSTRVAEGAAAAGGGGDAETELAAVRDDLMASGAFARLLAALTGMEVTHTRSVARRFRAGLDFSKASSDAASCAMTAGGMCLDATLCFVDDQDDDEGAGAAGAGGMGRGESCLGLVGMLAGEKRDMWQSSLVGGYQAYVDHQGSEPYEFYSGGGGVGGGGAQEEAEEEDGPLAQAAAERNTLFLALRDEGVARVVKYVSALAPGSRWDVALEASVRAED